MRSFKHLLPLLLAANGQNNFQTEFTDFEVIGDITKLEESTGVYKQDEAMIAFELSRLAYCGVDSYMNQEYNGVLEGFVPSKVIYSGVFDDTEGFIGYLPSAFSIFVVYRGSYSI
jgi:hypothetical protein